MLNKKQSKYRMKKLLIATLMLALATNTMAQNKMLSSKQLMTRGLYPARPLREVQFVGQTNKVAYIQGDTLYADGKILVSLEQMNAAMKATGLNSMRYIPRIKMESDKIMRFMTDGKVVRYNTASKSVAVVVDYGDHDTMEFDPETGAVAYTEGNALHMLSADGKGHWSISDPNPGIVYGQSVHRNEFGIDGGIFWSPRGSKLAFYRMDQSMVADYPLVNTRTRISTTEPFKYPMAGEKSHEVTIGVYDRASSKLAYLDSRKDTSVHEREMYLTNVTWSPDEKFLYVAKINREQNHMWLERYDAATGKLDKVLFEEQNERYVEPCEGLYFLPNNPNQFLWFSMRDGYKHLYLYNTDGTMLKQLTHGEYEVEGFISFDTKGENIFIYANKDNLTGRAAYRVNMKNGEMSRLTSAEGTHSVKISADGKLLIDEYSAVNIPARCNLADAKGNVKKTLYDSPNPLAEYAMPGIKMGTIKAADGKTDLYYRLMTPPNMDPGKKYPTLVYVYGGPHSQLVTDNWLGGANLYFTFLAQQGYVVFTVDNRGTDNRGFEFESCTHRQLGTIEMADQMEGVKFLQGLPYVDKDRMGVEGWSFGGFMTITMKLTHPEVFKVGCAGGPVIDWKWYEVMYGERYMDTPQENPDGYKNNSLLNKAKDLQGRLLVIHGAEDNTVVWQNSIEFIEACINNGKQVDYFIYPHHEHNVRGPERVHLFEKMFDYYETHLK